MEATQELREEFCAFITSRMESKGLSVSNFDDEIQSIYKELSSKLCHTRLGEFMDVAKQKAAAKEGKSTLAGQNLRDGLLTMHVQSKSKIS